MKIKQLFLLFLVIIFFRCEHENPAGPAASPPDGSELKALVEYQIVAKDSLWIHSSNDNNLSGMFYSMIVFGERDGTGGFSPADTVIPTYAGGDNQYTIGFSSAFRVPKSRVVYLLGADFYTDSGRFTSVDIPVALYTYPYPSAELYVNLDDLPGYPDQSDHAFAQGFACDQSDLYYQLSGGYGIYKTSLGNDETEQLYVAAAGDWIALAPNALFMDLSHSMIGRMDLATQQTETDFITNPNWWIRGMDFRSDTLYVLHTDKTGTGPCYLSTFDINGGLINTEYFSDEGWSFSISGDYMYTWTFGDILRYRISSKQTDMLTTKLDDSVESIRVKEDRLYYSDADKRIICSIPLPGILSISVD